MSIRDDEKAIATRPVGVVGGIVSGGGGEGQSGPKPKTHPSASKLLLPPPPHAARNTSDNRKATERI